MLIQSWTKPVDARLSRKLTFSCIFLILILTPPLSHSCVYTHALPYATLASALKQSQDPSSQDHVREDLKMMAETTYLFKLTEFSLRACLSIWWIQHDVSKSQGGGRMSWLVSYLL